MKNPFPLLVLALLGAACQPQNPPATTASTAVAPKAPAAKAAPEAKPTTPALPVTLSPEVLTMLGQVNLAPVLRNFDYKGGEVPMEGFYGVDNYRLSLILTQVQRDSLQPNVYHVAGKTRYKKFIDEVVGDIVLAQLGDYYFPEIVTSMVVDSAGVSEPAQGYSVLANFVLRSRRQPTSCLSGVAGLDFSIDKRGAIQQIGAPDGFTPDKQAASEGAGLLLRGEWLNGPAGVNRSFVLSYNLMLAAKDLFKDFGVGDRGGEINPKYAHLGWDKYWENDEWWANAQKPALSL